MRKKIRFILLYFLALPISFLVVAYALFIAFQFTTVADIRESFAEVDKQDSLAYGKVLFETRSCIGCHSIIPEQQNLGPNLFGISQRESMEYIRQSITSPNAVISPGFLPDQMPNFGDILDENQVNALVIYISSVK